MVTDKSVPRDAVEEIEGNGLTNIVMCFLAGAAVVEGAERAMQAEARKSVAPKGPPRVMDNPAFRPDSEALFSWVFH